jgi:hypothetical protein
MHAKAREMTFPQSWSKHDLFTALSKTSGVSFYSVDRFDTNNHLARSSANPRRLNFFAEFSGMSNRA